MNYSNSLPSAAAMQQMQQLGQPPNPAPHSQRIQVLEDGLAAAHDRISQLERLILEIQAKVG